MPRPQGFVLLWLLFWVAGLGVGMAALGSLWHTASQREKEAELLFVGDQFRQAIEAYHRRSPGGQPRYPARLEDLLQDPRFPQTVRHLRRLYVDPVTGKREWGLIKAADGGIAGVYSLARVPPMKTGGFPARYADFAGRTSLGSWRFMATGAVAMEEGNTAMTGTTASVQPTPEATPQRPSQQDSAWQERVVTCQAALEQAYQQCAQSALGHGGQFQACSDAASARHQRCLAGG
jgi:hypothetical protein